MTVPEDMNAAALGEQERARCAVCADVLATASVWSAAGPLMLFGMGLSVGLAWHWGRDVSTVALCWWVALLAYLTERYVAVRVKLDAMLFDRLSRGQAPGGLPSMVALDGALLAVLGVPAHRRGRCLDERLRGAQRWWRLHLCLIAAQAIWALGVVIWIQFNR